MTLGVLAIAWFGMAVLVGRQGSRLRTRLNPGAQAMVAVFVAVALVIIPLSGRPSS